MENLPQIIMPTEIYLAIAPVIAKSFTVPQIANLPILPPAKKQRFYYI